MGEEFASAKAGGETMEPTAPNKQINEKKRGFGILAFI
jgi:hypothetical protein